MTETIEEAVSEKSESKPKRERHLARRLGKVSLGLIVLWLISGFLGPIPVVGEWKRVSDTAPVFPRTHTFKPSKS